MIEYTRPYLPDYQKEIINAPERYTITEATTKAGKTVSHIVWCLEEAMKGKAGQNVWWTAPVYSQTEIAYNRLKRFITDPSVFKANESKLTITLANGVVIWFKSAEKPDNLYGEDVIAVVMDEFTRMREDSWYAIRSTLTATKGKAKFIGNVNGINNWGYRLAREAEKGKQDWKYFKITADDAVKAGILDQDEIDDAKRTLPEGVFNELYYGIPNENASNKFCYSFRDAHVGQCKVNQEYPVYLSFDFNYNPICCGIFQNYGGTIYCPELIKLENSNIYSLCKIIKSKYPHHLFIAGGDATGKAHSAMIKDNLNYYKIIQQELGLSISQMKVVKSNPTMEQNQVLVNAIFEHQKVIFDPDHAQPLIFDCKFVQVTNEGKILKTDRNDPAQQADALDTWRYYLNQEHKDFIKLAQVA